MDPEELLSQLSSEEKISLLSGSDMWHTAAVPRLNIPRVRMSDGPNGVRGTAWVGGAKASCFPCASALAASFNEPLLERVGQALGDECRARGVHCLLGPTTNIHRHPCGGRGFESYSEDPRLSGVLGAAWCRGVQSRQPQSISSAMSRNTYAGAITVCGYSTTGTADDLRTESVKSGVIDERTLHEIYLEPFRLQCLENPKAFMPSYNRVNGLHVTEHNHLLRKILREDFQFDGLAMSDWSGTTSSADTIKASLDLEMPGPAIMRGAAVERDVMTGKLTTADVDECVLRILKFVKHAVDSGIPFEHPEESIDNHAVRTLLREAAIEGIVLLKNENQTLPLTNVKGKKIAVIGPNADQAVISGGGSASLAATYAIKPLDGIKEAAETAGASVQYEQGVDTYRWTPLLSEYLEYPGQLENDAHKVLIEFFDTDPWKNADALPIFTRQSVSSFNYFIDGIPKEVPVRGWIKLRTTFVPDKSGIWQIGLGVAGQADLYVDGKKLIDNSSNQTPGLLFFTTGAEEVVQELKVEAGRRYQLEVRFSNFQQLSAMSPYAGRRGGMRIGGNFKVDSDQAIRQAVELCKSSDVTIVVVGTNSEWESEAYDRTDIKLPKNTDKLLEAILDVNPNAIIVNQSGMPVEMPWVKKASTLLQAFLGGNEAGNAIADVIFGKANPSGKLPVTFAKNLEDYPSNANFGEALTTVYAEGLNVGYRYFDRPGNCNSLFPFGYGLSYTTFAYSLLQVQSTDDFGVNVSFNVQNTGGVLGAEAAQVYVHAVSSQVERPDAELKGFVKVILSPGESKRVTVRLDHQAFSYYDVQKQAWVGEAGAYEIRVGSSSVHVAAVAPYCIEKSYSWVGLKEPWVLV